MVILQLCGECTICSNRNVGNVHYFTESCLHLASGWSHHKEHLHFLYWKGTQKVTSYRKEGTFAAFYKLCRGNHSHAVYFYWLLMGVTHCSDVRIDMKAAPRGA